MRWATGGISATGVSALILDFFAGDTGTGGFLDVALEVLELGFRTGSGTVFSDFLISVRLRFGSGEGDRSGEAARFFVGMFLIPGTCFDVLFGGGFSAGLVEPARVDLLGDISRSDLSVTWVYMIVCGQVCKIRKARIGSDQ